MSLNGGWVGYSGDAKIELAAGLLAVAGCAAYAGFRLRRPVRAVRPPASVVVLMFSLWAAALLAFLVGLGWWSGDRFRQVQLLLPDHADEPAMLEALAALIPSGGWLVTYNGRGFDWPLLETRYRMARRSPPAHAGHLDLLPFVRRVFRHRMADARLRTVETEVLGVERHEDVEGWQIPGRYLDFLRGGPADPLVEVVRHNDQDVRSLAHLVGHVERGYADPDARRGAPPGCGPSGWRPARSGPAG